VGGSTVAIGWGLAPALLEPGWADQRSDRGQQPGGRHVVAAGQVLLSPSVTAG
jgi:hypothetical protein